MTDDRQKETAPALSEQEIAEIERFSNKHEAWRKREIVPDTIYAHLEFQDSPGIDIFRAEANEKSHKVIEFDLKDGAMLPAVTLTAFAPIEILHPAIVNAVFDPDTRPEERRQLMERVDIDKLLSNFVDDINAKWELQPGQSKTIRFFEEKKMGRGRKLDIRVELTTKTTLEQDDDAVYPSTTFDKLRLEFTHTPARVKSASVQRGVR